MPLTYEDLLKQVKQGQQPSEDTIRTMQAIAVSICDQLGSDLRRVNLTDEETVRQLLMAKFAESELVGPVSVQEGEPPTGRTVVYLTNVIIGVYEEAAFNVTVVLVADAMSVYFSKVPEGGNYR